MFKIILFFIYFLVSWVCSKSTLSDEAVDIVRTLQIRYNDLSSNCLDSKDRTKPAYECSGLIIRGVNIENSEMKFAWSKKESNRRTNAFSVGFLRRDQLFSELLGYDTGFIIYPHLKTPSNRQQNELKVFCAFPVDANTNGREGHHGCGKLCYDDTETSRSCDVQGINSLSITIIIGLLVKMIPILHSLLDSTI